MNVLFETFLLQFLLLYFLYSSNVCGFLIGVVPNYHEATQLKRHYLRNTHALEGDTMAGRELDMIKRIVDSRVSFKECNLDPGERGDCGFFGMDEEDCYKRRECCWGESSTEGVPWCYHSKPTIKAECAMWNNDRLECGFYGIRKEQCLTTGCCWKPTNENGVPWCYHIKRIPAFTGECGIPPISPSVAGRIVGGTEVKAHSWPWQVSLQAGDHFCGGSLINQQWILTAAHCEPGFEWGNGDQIIEIGMHDLHDRAKFQRTVTVDQIISHEDYNSKIYDSDIMLIKLSEKIDFGEYIQPVCLPEANQRIDVGTHCYTTGWGHTEFMGSAPKTLQQVMVPILSDETCNRDDWYGGRITDNMLCAGYHEGGRDSCQGDSGGPLVCYIDEHWILYGIVSWGEGCAQEAKPGLYTRVSNFVVWVEKMLSKYSK